mgnify:CR=1 FL=1
MQRFYRTCNDDYGVLLQEELEHGMRIRLELVEVVVVVHLSFVYVLVNTVLKVLWC